MKKLFAGLFLLLSLTAQSGTGFDPKPEWLECKTAGDCIDIKYTCTDLAVNRKFEKEARKFYEQAEMTLNCISRPKTESEHVLVCLEKKCQHKK